MAAPQDPSDAIDEIYTDPAPIVDFVKMQIAFWEKLVVLDAATLAASFTASGIFREHFTGDGGVVYLAAAWKLLLAGVSLCLLAQWMAIPGAIAVSGHYYSMRVLSLLNKATGQASDQEADLSSRQLAISSEIIAQSPKLRSRAQFCSRLAGALGSFGLLATIVAFYWLYRFAHVNIARIGH